MSLADLNDGHLVGFGVVLMGLFLFLLAYVNRRRKIGLHASGVRTSARVASVSKRTMEGSTFYRFALEFEHPGGGLVAAKTNVPHRYVARVDGFDDLLDGSSPGQDVFLPVVYDPDHPKRVDIEAVLNAMRPERGALALGWLWLLVVVLVGAGLVFIAIGGGDPICSVPDIGRQSFCDGFGR
jgi:hypothetical protein